MNPKGNGMSKKLFVLLLVAMFLTTTAILVLTLTGHQDIVIAAGAWLTRSISNGAQFLGVFGILILIVLLT